MTTVTAQAPDRVRYEHGDFAIAGVSGDGLFDPAHVELDPTMMSTACWRGYVVEYAVVSGFLRMVSVRLGRGTTHRGRDLALGDALLGGRVVIADDWLGDGWLVEGLDMPVAFTGRLLLGDGFVARTYRHMGFHPAWKYATVLELTFLSGACTAAVDLSERFIAVREGVLAGDLEDPDGPAAGMEWIKRTFTLDYARSGLSPDQLVDGRSGDVEGPDPR
jgi:hypothetical protein